MAWVIEKIPDKDGLVRSVKLHIGCKSNSDQTLTHPITKLVLLFRMKMYDSPTERLELNLGVMKVPKYLTLLKPYVLITTLEIYFMFP